jgi:hypothetical protein
MSHYLYNYIITTRHYIMTDICKKRKSNYKEINQNPKNDKLSKLLTFFNMCSTIEMSDPTNSCNFDIKFSEKIDDVLKNMNDNTIDNIINTVKKELEQNQRNKKIICCNAHNTFVNLVTSFEYQLNCNNKIITINVKGCTNFYVEPTLEGWLEKNEGKAISINYFINDKKMKGYDDIRIIGVSSYKFDDDFGTWDGGTDLIIECTNIHFTLH